jgi:hypothetical protein
MKVVNFLLLTMVLVALGAAVVSFISRPTAAAASSQGNVLNVQEAQNPANHPFRAGICKAYGVNASLLCGNLLDNFTVPAAVDGQAVKRLVIEEVSTSCDSDADIVFLSTSSSGGPSFSFPTTTVVAGKYAANQLTRIYADPGADVGIQLQIQTGIFDVCKATISGYLVTQ